MKKTILIPTYKGGYTNDFYDLADNGTFQKAEDCELFTQTRTLTPHLSLGSDLINGADRNKTQLVNCYRAANDGKYYFCGFDSTNGTAATLWQATTLGSSTTLTSIETSGTVIFGKPIEFVDGASTSLFYQTDTTIRKYNFTVASQVVTGVINQAPLFVHDGLKKIFYTTARNAIGASSSSTLSATAVLTLNPDQLVINMAPYGAFVAIGVNTKNNSKPARILMWDGTAATVADSIELPDSGLMGIKNINNTIYALCSSNTNGLGKFNVIRLYAWSGGPVRLVRELDLKPTAVNLVTINTQAVAANKGILYFGMNATNSGSMTIDNGIWAYNPTQDLLTLDRITETTTNINVQSIDFVDGSPMITFFDGTNYRLNHVPASGAKSTRATYWSNIIHFDPVYKGKIERIEIRHQELPSSTGFTIKLKQVGAYSDGGVPTAASFSTAATQTTANSTRTVIGSINGTPFSWADAFQLEIDFDTASGVNAPSIVFPIIVNCTISEEIIR